MLQPKKVQYRRHHKGKGSLTKGLGAGTLEFGSFGIQALDHLRLPARTLETLRRILVRTLERKGKLWLRVFPDLSVSSKPNEVRMGKGKGAPSWWAARVKKGTMLVEMCDVDEATAIAACASVSHGLKIPVRLVTHSKTPGTHSTLRAWGTLP
jgi:large subunit ribosomal protein L16